MRSGGANFGAELRPGMACGGGDRIRRRNEIAPCGIIGHQPFWGRCPKRKKQEKDYDRRTEERGQNRKKYEKEREQTKQIIEIRSVESGKQRSSVIKGEQICNRL